MMAEKTGHQAWWQEQEASLSHYIYSQEIE